MTEALAKRNWPDCRVKSVGIDVLGKSGAPAAAQAIKAMDREFGLDIKGHKTTSIKDVDVGDFQFVICLSEEVKRHVTKLPEVVGSAIKYLYVDDPCGNDIDQYLKCARTINDGLRTIGF